MIITFTLPFRLKSKSNSYRAGKGRVFKAPAIVTQESAIRSIALISLPSPYWQPSIQPWKVEINLYVSDKRRFDIDNTAKILLDCLNEMVWKDDSQVTLLIIRKRLGCAKTETEVILTEL
jgi:Holliday junction resolvase RusA-like endonuclease